MPVIGRGQMLRASVLASVMLVVGACGSNPPPPASTRPLSVSGVYSCALSVLQMDGWEQDREYQGSEPEFRSASLRGAYLDRQSAYTYAALRVGRTDQGEITLQIVRGPFPDPSWEEQMRTRIVTRCLS